MGNFTSNYRPVLPSTRRIELGCCCIRSPLRLPPLQGAYVVPRTGTRHVDLYGSCHRRLFSPHLRPKIPFFLVIITAILVFELY